MGNANGHLLNMMDPESKSLIVTQKGGNSAGLTSLINRQLIQGEFYILAIYYLIYKCIFLPFGRELQRG